jgi:anthraniloyl-CoA monooxygenase
MRITIIGAGPAGLYFALLMKKADPSREITVYERDGADDTFGWGIVFSDQTFSYLRDSDEPSFEELVANCENWDNVDVVHRDQKISIHGNRFSGIARITFLKILQRRARELGVDLRFHANVAELSQLPPTDLLVGADGANSAVRLRHAAFFHPEVAPARNRYIWLGTPRLFHGLTLTFRETEWGPFAAHSYKFSKALSTFIIECGPDTWERAGFAAMNERETLERLSGIFSRDLQGAPFLTNNFVKWLNFTLVRNQQWHHDHVVLLGDALHTAHFSIGSGTKLALEDAIALAQAFAERPAVADALPYFQQIRKPIVDALQGAAVESLRWFEQWNDDVGLEPVVFAYRLMTRSGRIDKEKLRRRDPAFVEAYERAANVSSA